MSTQHIAGSNGRCPYRGLEPYTELYSRYFVGRERDQQTICANLFAMPMTVLYGASGVGKSSVLLAGVVPHLKETAGQAVVVFRNWQGDGFIGALKQQVLDAVNQVAASKVKADPTLPFDAFLQECNHALSGPIYLIFDQFEEYFLYHSPSKAKDSFDSEFARIVNSRSVDAKVLISMRGEELSKLDRFRGRIPNILGNMLRLDHLDRASAERAILEPLIEFNRNVPSEEKVTIENDLVTALLDKSMPDPELEQCVPTIGSRENASLEAGVETPVLQILLTRLWQEEMKAGSRTLRLSTFNETLGGAESIISSYLDEKMNQLSEPDRNIAASIFRFLVTPSRTKIAQDIKALADWADIPEDQVESVLTLLSLQEMRVVRIVRVAGQPLRYEIFHDVLARAIFDWREAYAQKQKEARAAQLAAEEAARTEKEAARELQLEQAKALAEARAAQLAAQETARREKEAAQELQLKQAQALAESERQHAAEQERRADEKAASARRLRRLAAALAVAIVLTAVSTVMAVRQGRQKNRAASKINELERTKADAERAQAAEQIRVAKELKDIAEERARETETQKKTLEAAKEKAELRERQARAAQQQAMIARAQAEIQKKELISKNGELKDAIFKEKERRRADSWANYGETTFYQTASQTAYQTADLKTALEAHNRAIEIFRKIDDANGEARTLSGIGGLYLQQANNSEAGDKQKLYEEAENYFQEAVHLREKIANDGASDPDERLGKINELARAINSEGVVVDYRGRYVKAQPFYERALMLRQQTLPSNHPELALSYRNVGLIHQSLGEYVEAEQSIKKAIAIETSNEASARDTNQLGIIRFYQGRYPEADLQYKDALKKMSSQPENAFIGSIKHNQALLYLLQGKYELVEPREREAMSIKRLAPQDHDGRSLSLMVLARLFREQGKYADAEPLYRQALDEAIKVNGQENSRVATYSHYLAQFYAAQSKYEQAEPLEKKAIAIFENGEMLKPDNWFKYRSVGTLAMIYAGTRREQEAESLYKESAKHLEQLLGPDHPETANSLTGLAELYLREKRYNEAEPLIRRALDIREKRFDSEHPDVAVSLNDLGKLYREQSRYAEAEKYFRQAIAIDEKRKPDHPDFAQTLEDYALLLRKTNRADEAASMEARARVVRDKFADLNRKKNICAQ